MSKAPRSDVVTFGIPLISRAAASDWPLIERLFNATLASLYNQTDPHFRIIVATSGRPMLTQAVDARLSFIDRPRPLPKNHLEAAGDGGLKRWEIAARHVELGGGHLMFVDADDLVSARMVEFIRRTNHPDGVLVTHGYAMDWRSGRVAPCPLSFMPPDSFHRKCATCVVLNLNRRDLFEGGPDGMTRFQRIYGPGHHLVYDAMVAEGRPPMPVPFPAAVYVLNTGQNLSCDATSAYAAHPFPVQAQPYIEKEQVAITPELQREFMIPPPGGDVPPRLSVAISTYKRPQGLRRLLTALRPLVQGNPAREIVVVNDGSHDAAYQSVVDEFAGVIRYRPLDANVGIAKARNASAEMARGEYLVFTDDDCEPPDWWLDWLEARLDSNPELDVVAGTTKPLWPERPRFIERVFAHYDVIPHPWSTGSRTLFVTANVAIRRNAFWRRGGFGFGDEFPRAGEDSELASRMLRSGARIATDLTWFVRHDINDTLRTQMKRYWRYGYANVWMSRLTTAPENYVSLTAARRRHHWSNALVLLRRHLELSTDFASSRVVRFASALAATLIWVAYYDGCAVAAAERRSELGL